MAKVKPPKPPKPPHGHPVRDALARIEEKLDTLLQAAGSSGGPALARIEAALATLADALRADFEAMAARLDTVIRQTVADPEKLAQLEQQIAALRARSESATARLKAAIQANTP